MPHHEHIKIEGRVTDVFFHRFVVTLTDGGKLLADIGPKGAEAFILETGMDIVAEGEMKPSELKVDRIARSGEPLRVVEHGKKHGPAHDQDRHHHDHNADPAAAKQAVEKAGFQAIGEPRRKPKHFEVLARQGGRYIECHVEFDGHIRKEKPVASDDHKWADCLKHAA